MRKFLLNALILIVLVQVAGFASHAAFDPDYEHVPSQVYLISNMIDPILWVAVLVVFFGVRKGMTARQ